MKSPFYDAEWITAEEFADQPVINTYHKEYADVPEPECPEEFRNFHMLTTGEFELCTVPEKAIVRVTADDYYFLSVNDRFVCQGPAPGYPTRYHWNETDVTEFLKPGLNRITLHVYYHGLVCRAYTSADRRQGCILAIVDENGNTIAKTDSRWRYSIDRSYTGTEVIGYNTIFKEGRDLRVKPENERPVRVKNVDYIFAKEPAVLLQVYERAPVVTEPLENGGWFVDFGEELTGTLAFTANGTAGEKVRVLIGEETGDSDVRVRYNMRCSCDCDEYVILDAGVNHYQQFDYRGFRYAAVVPENGAGITDLRARVRHYPFDDDYCILETEDEILQSVFQICKNGVKYGAQEVYVDCPTREKGQYSGDMTITSGAQLALTGDIRLLRKSMDDLIHSSFICPGLMAVITAGLNQEIADYSLQFPIIALRYYQYTGDRDYLADCLEVCEQVIDYFKQFARADGLLENAYDKWNLVDWPKNLRDDYDFDSEAHVSGVHNVLNAFYIGCVLQTEEIRAILGVQKEKDSPALIRAFESAFFDAGTNLYTDSEHGSHSALHSNILPLFYGFARKDAEEHLLRFIYEKGTVCGVYMAWFLLKALCRYGRYDDAYRLIVDQGVHSWYNMVREGGTTCFEAWGKDQKWNTSLCHPWASGPIPVLYEDILPNRPGYGRIILKKEEI